MNWKRFVLGALLSGVPAGLSSCSTFESSGLPGSASSMARNQIMWVDKESKSFGYYRVMTHRKAYPDLQEFLRQKGLPDFLAETRDGSRSYYILYYLGSCEAYASRTSYGRSGHLEFSGPYPISPGEYDTLEHMRNP